VYGPEDMKDKDDGGSPFRVELAANAKLEVKAEVPTQSVGGFVDALTDLIRP